MTTDETDQPVVDKATTVRTRPGPTFTAPEFAPLDPGAGSPGA